MKQDIINWLSSDRNFNIGISLLSKFSKRRQMINFITRKGECSQTQEKLAYELSKLAGVKHTEIKATGKPLKNTEQPRDVIQPKQIPEDKYQDAGENVKQLVYLMKEAFNTRAQLHQKMASLPEDAVYDNERAELFNIIKSFSELIDNMFVLRDRFDKEGIEPTANELESLDWTKVPDKEQAQKETLPDFSAHNDKTTSELIKRANNIPTYVSKAKKRIKDKGLKGDRLKKELEKIENYSLELAYVNNLIKERG